MMIRRMLGHNVSITAIFLALIVAVSGEEFSLDIPESCRNVSITTRSMEIPVGWPMSIDCENQVDNLMFPSSNSAYRCVITTQSMIVFERNFTMTDEDIWFGSTSTTPYRISSVTSGQSGSVYTSYVTSGEECDAVSYTLLVRQSSNTETCENATFHSTVDDFPLIEGGSHRIPCVANKSIFHLQDEKYRVKWYKNCHEIKTVEKQDLYQLYDGIDNLVITNVDIDSVGGYSCSVTYGGQEMFLTRTNTCFKYPTSSFTHYQQLTPPKSKATLGDDVTLQCGGVAGFLRSVSYAIIWIRHFKNGTEKVLCRSMPHGDESDTRDMKYQCNMLSNLEEASKCFTNVEDAVKYDRNTRANSSLLIRDFQNSDQGKYTCRLITTRGETDISFEVGVKSWNSLFILLPAVLGLVLLVLVSLLLVKCLRKGDLLERWRKRCTKPDMEKSTKDPEDTETTDGKNISTRKTHDADVHA